MNAMSTATAPSQESTVLHVGGLHYASEKAVVEHALGNRPGVLAVDANPVAQTATVTFDPAQTSVEDLRRWVEECGYHCAGQSVPGHVCDPMAEPGAEHAAHDHAAAERADDAHGHGHGGHAGMSMESMVRDMRNRFLVALVFTIPIVAVVDGRHEAARHRARDAVRHRPRRLAVPAQPADRPLRLVHLLHRRGVRAARTRRWT